MICTAQKNAFIKKYKIDLTLKLYRYFYNLNVNVLHYTLCLHKQHQLLQMLSLTWERERG